MKKIVIIGGGFGGVYSAKCLLKHCKNEKVALISDKNYFLFTPLLHEVATGAQNRHNVVLEIREFFKQKNFEFINSQVSEIDFNKKSILINEGKLNYDILILAIGSQSNFFNIKGADIYSIPLKNIHDVTKIRNKIILSLEKASITNDDSLTTFAIVGGGPTGVELAGELSEFVEELSNVYKKINKSKVKIYIIQRSNRFLDFLTDNKSSELALQELRKKGVLILSNSAVTEVTEDSVIINNKTKIKTKNIFWAAGVKPNTIKTIPKITNEKGFYEVNEFFEVKNVRDVYAIGDCALNFNPGSEKPNQLTAQLATKQAHHLAKNLSLKLKNKSQIPFIFKPAGFLVSVGSWWAIAELNNMVFRGIFAWWLWRTIYLSKIIGIKNKIRVGVEWFLLLFSKRDGSEI